MPALEMLCLPWATTTNDRKALTLMEEALAKGVDPNGFYRSGGDVTALGALSVVARNGKEVPEEKYASLLEAASMLVEAGANPMNDMELVFDTTARRFCADLIKLLAAREDKGAPIRDYKGQSLLHALTLRDPSFIPDGVYMPVAWVNAQRSPDLFTPLHYAWSQPEQDYGTDQNQKKVMTRLQYEYLWDKTQKLIDRGARLDLESLQGESVASLIARRVREDNVELPSSPKVQGVWPAIQAHCLAEATASPMVQRPSSSPRL